MWGEFPWDNGRFTTPVEGTAVCGLFVWHSQVFREIADGGIESLDLVKVLITLIVFNFLSVK